MRVLATGAAGGVARQLLPGLEEAYDVVSTPSDPTRALCGGSAPVAPVTDEGGRR